MTSLLSISIEDILLSLSSGLVGVLTVVVKYKLKGWYWRLRKTDYKDVAPGDKRDNAGLRAYQEWKSRLRQGG